MSIPDFNSDISPYNLGVSPNNSDDDAEILDNLVEQDATPPEPVDIPRFDIPPVPKVEIPAQRRTVFSSALLPLGKSFQILYPNPWREKAIITTSAPTNTALSTDSAVPSLTGGLPGPGSIFRITISPTAPVTLEGNSPIWATQWGVSDGLLIYVMEIIKEEAGR